MPRDGSGGATRGARLLPLLMLVVLGACWGGNPNFGKALSLVGVHPFAVVFWQTAIAGAIILAVCVVRRQSMPLDWPHLRFCAFMGIVTIALPYALMVHVAGAVSAGYMSVVVLLSPVLTYLIALAVVIERFVLLRAGGIAAGIAGATLLVVPHGSLPAPELIGVALAGFLVPVGYAVANIYAEVRRPAGTANAPLAAGTMLTGAAATLVLSLATGNFVPVWQDPVGAGALVLAYGVVTAVAYLLYFGIIAMAGAVYLAQAGFLVALFGILWGILFFAERHSAWMWAAVALVAGGVALVNLGKAGRRLPASVGSPPRSAVD
ncbi:MAG: DMT family transporter [Alphaproteobacteria bacterium]|nr:DMT family transporter [Alphaproteobacteria bacterium]